MRVQSVKNFHTARSVKTYVRPSNHVVSGLLKGPDDGVFHDLVRDVKIVAILDECERWLAAAGVPPNADVRVNVRDNASHTVVCLKRDGVEKEIHRLLESLDHPRVPGHDATAPPAKGWN